MIALHWINAPCGRTMVEIYRPTINDCQSLKFWGVRLVEGGPRSGNKTCMEPGVENYWDLLEPLREPSHFSNSFPKTLWAHFGTERASFMSSPT